MKTEMIPQNEWRLFFRDFSRIHNGALISIRVTGPATSRDEIIDQPFLGISEDGDEVFIHAGDGVAHPHLERRMRYADLVNVERTDEGADAAVAVTSLDGTRTTMRFRSPALPELLDPAVE